MSLLGTGEESVSVRIGIIGGTEPAVAARAARTCATRAAGTSIPVSSVTGWVAKSVVGIARGALVILAIRRWSGGSRGNARGSVRRGCSVPTTTLSRRTARGLGIVAAKVRTGLLVRGGIFLVGFVHVGVVRGLRLCVRVIG